MVRAGVEEHILTLLRGLDRSHFRLLLACMPEVAEKLRPDLPVDVEVIEIRLDGLGDLSGVWQLHSLLERWQPHVLHSHLFQASRCASPLGLLCQVPLIVETTHVREQWRKGWVKGSFVIDRAVGRCVDYFIAVSQAQREYLVESKRLPEEKVIVIPNGADLARFRPEHKVPDGLRASLGLEEGDPVIAVVARLDPQKGHHVLLDALPQVRKEFPRLCVICLGDGALRRQLCQQARDLGLENVVRFVGYQANPEDWLALADFTVLPSYFEGLPIAAIESLAMEKAMVASAVDGTTEVVVDGMTGLTVPPGQSPRLAEAICRLLRDRDLRQRLGLAGRERVLQKFSHTQQVRKTGQFYLRALRRPTGAIEKRMPLKNRVHPYSALAASEDQPARQW
jgi:glycosyltransferase involved in cell wall biosynthesis